MIEPLLLKSEPSTITRTNKNIITVADLISKFQLKSPTARQICFTDRTPHSTRHAQTPKYIKINQIRSIQLPKTNNPIASEFPSILKQIKLQTPNNVKRNSQKQGKLFYKNSNCKENIVNLMQDKSVKKYKMPIKLNLPLKKCNKQIGPTCLSERTTPNTYNHTKSNIIKTKIFLDKKNINQRRSTVLDEQKYFRKQSSASTLSLKTKHTLSMHQFQQDSDVLFSNFTRNSSAFSINKVGNQNVLGKLQETKKKLYQQLYALDKKLLCDYEIENNKKAIVICLKKKTAKLNAQKDTENNL